MFKTIIVTGGAGFIGSNLTLALAGTYPGAAITVIDDFRCADFRNLEGFRGDIVAADLRTMELGRYFRADGVDAVFHLASITDTTEANQRLQVRDNVESWRNLLGFFAGRRARLVYASSAATYGIAGGVNRLEQELRPANAYAFSKVHLENLARKFAAENPGQWITGLRYFNVYGPREAHKGKLSSMICQLARAMLAGRKPRIFRYGEQRRDFVYVDDVVRYTLAAAASGGARAPGMAGIFNAGSGVARSFNDIVANLNRVLKLNLEAEYIDNPYPFYQPHTEADLAATRKQLDIEPRFSLERGIDAYLDSGWLTADSVSATFNP